MLADGEAVNLFKRSRWTRKTIKDLFSKFSWKFLAPGRCGIPRFVDRLRPGETYMEGGLPAQRGPGMGQRKELADIFELSISLEVNSQDLYIKMERGVEDPKAKKAFQLLAQAEKNHLERLSSLLEKSLREEE